MPCSVMNLIKLFYFMTSYRLMVPSSTWVLHMSLSLITFEIFAVFYPDEVEAAYCTLLRAILTLMPKEIPRCERM
jgi:hypothetical protein